MIVKADNGKLNITPHFVSSDSDLDELLDWGTRNASIKDSEGKIIFEQKEVEFPHFWSDTAVAVVSDKYFRGIGDEKERSLKQLVNRVVDTITVWGIEQEYFDEENAKIFNLDMKFLIFNQYYAFNSPVWFNVGIEEKPQVSACFIQGVEDDMTSIMELAFNEAMIFKHGSGSGTNFSELRAKNEVLSGGGKASGPVSFMKGFDAFSGVIKSGGKTRRAAKMAILDDGHPDIMEFIESKYKEEMKALALVMAGYNPDFNDEDGAYSSVALQNENHAVRCSDAFMRKVKEDGEWHTYYVKSGELANVLKSRDVLTRIAECAHACGDPGIQFSDTINAMHTTPASGEIKGSNPCSEYLNINDSACNLGSHNLMRYTSITKDGFDFDVPSFIAAVELTTLAQEIMVDKASYPTDRITANVKAHRQLGLGYANLGTMLMYCGLRYDSDEGRALAASIASLMTAASYHTSAHISSVKGPFSEYEDNTGPVKYVLSKHLKSCEELECDSDEIENIRETAEQIWEETIDAVEEHGLRNSQATLLAPTGTIGMMMDCDTTGVEPETSLVKYKSLVGGGTIKMVNRTIGHALHNLGYSDDEVSKILTYLHDNEELDNCTLLKKHHLPIFDCAFRTQKTGRIIKPQGHVKMLAAIQPHISGGISKTVNLPESSTVKDVYDIFMLAYDLGVKCLTIYRDGSKSSQPLNIKKQIEKEKAKESANVKRTMPDLRKSVTHKFSIGGTYKGYLIIGFFNDNTVGEIFIESSKAGSTMNGLLDSFATMVSIGLQHGVPLEKIVRKFAHVAFEPSGFTTNPDIGLARSIVDYIARYLEKYIIEKKNDDGNITSNEFNSDAPPCHRCGAIMVRSGTCFKCLVCGETSGCS